MKVLSVQEPWASLVKEQIKQIETRSWKTNYRGELYIHASKKICTKKEFAEYTPQISLLKEPIFDYGCIIAKCILDDCILMTEEFIEEIKNNKIEYLCGDYQVGRYAWILKDIKPLVKPIPAKGSLGIWKYKED
ncbi:MAG: ASCH domain-containing protein [Bacilli bacterium]|nr:ASCH domain-containing protein [Bacilli bacterium]